MKHSLTLLALTFAVVLVPSARCARVYFTDQQTGAAGSVISVAPDGTGQQTLITVSNTPDLRGIAYHRASGRIFFLDNGAAKKIYSIRPDGSEAGEVVSISPNFNADLEIDDAADKLYWAENTDGLIRSADLNGSNVQTAVTPGAGATAPYFFFIDRPGGHIYWGVLSGGNGPSSFGRASLADGVIDPNFTITTSTRTRDIGIDPRTSTAYWCDRQTGTIFKRALSGGANQAVIAGLNAPHGIALDLEADKIYWADTGGRGTPPQGLSVRRVARCNFDGTEFENISTPAVNSEPWDLALDLSSPSYAEWRTRFFSSNATNAGPSDDPDGDGANNVVEYGLGTHPRKSPSVPRIASRGTGLTYSRRRGTDLVFTVEVSTNLNFNVWHFNGDGSGLAWTSEISILPTDLDFETVIVTPGPALAGASNAFFRVGAALVPP